MYYNYYSDNYYHCRLGGVGSRSAPGAGAPMKILSWVFYFKHT